MILAATMSTVDRADVGLFFSECGAGPLVLLHTGGGGDGEMFRLAGDEPSEWRREAAARVRATGMAVAMQAFAEREAEPPPQWLLDNLSSTETEMFALQLEASVADPPLWDRFPLVAAPTLLVCGELEEYEEGGRAAHRGATPPCSRGAARERRGVRRARARPSCGLLAQRPHAPVDGPLPWRALPERLIHTEASRRLSVPAADRMAGDDDGVEPLTLSARYARTSSRHAARPDVVLVEDVERLLDCVDHD